MTNPKDTRAQQIQTNKVIVTGSTGTGARILIYPIEAEDASSPNRGVRDPAAFGTGSIGTDVFLYVSGAIGSKGTSVQGTTVIGGDFHISGNITSEGGSIGGTAWAENDGSHLSTTSSVSVGTAAAPETDGADVFMFVSGTIGSKDSSTQGLALFGGDVAVSGTLYSSGSNIGDAEDGTYTDGLFTDFTESTLVGTAVDRFNEVLKSLSPSAAPALDDLGVSDTGAGGKLSFGSSNAIGGYTNVAATGSLTAEDINDDYIVTTLGSDLRRGIFGASTTVNGILNDDVTADSPNYEVNSLGDGDIGSLIVDLNGVDIITIDLTSTANAITGSSGSSFVAVSPLIDGAFSNGDPFTVFKHREGVWSIAAASQRNGWNYFKVTHDKGSTSSITNFVSWVVDDDTTQIFITTASLDSLVMTGTAKVTGIEYHTGGTAAYSGSIDHAYRNTYSRSSTALSFGGSTNLTISSRALSSMTAESDVEELGEVATVSGTKLYNAGITGSVTVDHPITGDELTNGGAAGIGGILMYTLSGSSAATVLTEDYREEEFRMESGSFNIQSDVTSAANEFDPGASRSTGIELFVFNERLVAKPSLANGGDFATITNGPGSNVDYSGISGTALGTYFRRFQNNTGGSKSNFDLTINGATGTIVTGLGSVSGNSILVEIKLPGDTGWTVLIPFGTGPAHPNDGAGSLNGAFDSSLSATNGVTFGGLSVADNDYVMVKITAEQGWAGYSSSMTVAWT